MEIYRSYHAPLYRREIGKQNSSWNVISNLAFSKHKVRSLSLSPVWIQHSGCINTATWDNSGELLYTGSDDLTVKIWRLAASDDVSLTHDVATKHRGNIFCVAPKPDDHEVIITGAADGTIRTSYLHSRHGGNTLHTSDDFIHKVHFDHENPSILYSAEECGHIHRWDLRSGKKERIFEHRASCYSLCSEQEKELTGVFFPSWRGLGSVKALAQTTSVASPHLIVGGKGYMIGMLDLRLVHANSINVSDAVDSSSAAHLVNPYVKLWSPAFPYDNDNQCDPRMAELYHNIAAPYHAYGKSIRNPKSKTSMIHGSFSSLSISGLQVSKDGQRMVANVQGDQLFTFNLRSAATCTGVQALIGGHVNYSTFLKDVSFFGPQDEYVTCGSDSGHMWIWESRLTRRPRLIGGQRDSYACRLINVLRADRRTCNGVAVHPYAPVLVSYGIDDDAK
eukprot:gene41757-50963_t